MPREHEYVKFWQDATLSNLELLHATYVRHSFAPHTHEGYAIGVIEQGAEQFAYRRRQHVAPVGSIVFINPGEVHTGSAAAEHGWTYRMLYPSTGLLQQAVSDLTGRTRDIPFFTEPVVHDPDLGAEISLTHRALEEHASTLERESRMLWTLARLILRYADDHPRPRLFTKEHMGIQRVRSYLEENYAENISLDQLAAIASLSPFHLLRSFRDQVGLPPHAYQIQTRIRHAKALLGMGMSCVDIAITVGFADQSHFTRHFKRIVGVPPGLYGSIFHP
ncbi:AraC family transcriptional regulator [Dictyobacter aurantiacus]|uniref:AraC family transcriptional regulator n=1 Tax=Dictyobacter aurantiacus TaxID=1936993 RepID=A0A401ZP75_9CHLR|nr:AraC family transcriptional regulator [Dictyobacter aurantiacus]GCE08679.1 AraC family transcriptional regulator [Dictyobacter aurantiacus]